VLLLLRLVRLLRQIRPDIVHCFTIKCVVYGSFVGRLIGLRGRVNAVAGMGYVFTNPSLLSVCLRPVVRMLLKFALGGRNCRVILQNPDDVNAFVQGRVLPSCNIRLVPGSGVDCERFRPPSVKKLNSPLKVLMAARLLWDKGLEEYADAARSIRRSGRPITFLLAGIADDGNPAAVPESVVRGWVEEGTLEWLGHVDDMAAFLRDVDIVVLPSFREGLPKSLIEAGASGCAIVTTDAPGCREVVSVSESDGLLVPVRNSHALAGAIVKLADDGDLRARIGAAARETALRRFDQRIIIKDTLKVYAELAPMQGDEAHGES
jgi:glycosyltransferase involved in cell wall biosynthesis